MVRFHRVLSDQSMMIWPLGPGFYWAASFSVSVCSQHIVPRPVALAWTRDCPGCACCCIQSIMLISEVAAVHNSESTIMILTDCLPYGGHSADVTTSSVFGPGRRGGGEGLAVTESHLLQGSLPREPTTAQIVGSAVVKITSESSIYSKLYKWYL